MHNRKGKNAENQSIIFVLAGRQWMGGLSMLSLELSRQLVLHTLQNESTHTLGQFLVSAH